MVIGAIRLDDIADLTKFSEKEIFGELDPTKMIDSIDMGPSLRRDGYYTNNFIIYVVSCLEKDNEAHIREFEELYKCFVILQKAVPKLIRAIRLKGNKLVIVYPFYPDEQNTMNFITIKQELLRVTQFLFIHDQTNLDKIADLVLRYSKMLIKYA